MVKAVFFDWFNTLACFDPPREKLQSQAFQELGVKITPSETLKGLLVADKNWFEENVRSKIEERGHQDQAALAIRYEETILAEARIEATEEILAGVVSRVQELYKGMTFALFDDVLSTLKILKGWNLVLGVLTNLTRDMEAICRSMGLDSYLNFIVTSGEVGVDKPQPPIFLTALERAGVQASEAVHVGDQYKIDVAGARGVGIRPILIDRYNLSPEVSDCPRVCSLSQVVDYL